MSTADEVRSALKRRGESRGEHRRGAADDMTEIERLIREGKELGLDIAEMARLADISRQTVYTILGGTTPPDSPNQ